MKKMPCACSLLLLPVLLAISPASAYYYMGSSLMFTPKGQDQALNYLLEIRTRHMNRKCYQNHFTCALDDCGTIIQSVSTQIANGTEDFTEWCQNEVVTVLKLSTNRAFEIKFPTYLNVTTGHGYWAQSVQSTNMDWRMKTHIDLGTRSDTKKANRSPVAAMMPFVRIPKNCGRDYKLLISDPDGDYIRCRVPGSSNDCSLCRLPKGFSLLQDTCTIRFHQTAQSGLFPIELVLDDFPTNSIYLTYSNGFFSKKCPLSLSQNVQKGPPPTKPPLPEDNFVSTIGPLSIVPEQFTIQVDPFMAESCAPGDYFPIFLTPTPSNGVIIPAYAGRTQEVRVKMMAKHTLLHDFIVTGPEGISYSSTFTDEYVIKWTPTPQDEDKYIPVCFVAEGIDINDQIYQSELRCFMFVVQIADFVVTCNETNMMVEIKRSDYINRFYNELHVNDFRDPACDLSILSNSTHIVTDMTLHTCGTIIEEDEENIIFKNQITNGDPSEVISRHLDVEIFFACAYPKRNNLTVGFRHKNIYAFTEKGFGTFSFQFHFYETAEYTNRVNHYPLEVPIKQMMYMQIELMSTVSNAVLFVESCVATPFGDLNTSAIYRIIENGCPIDESVEIYNSTVQQFRFGMEAFEFVIAREEVYITCLVLLCVADYPGTRCSQGCITSPNTRQKRETVPESSWYTISQGPVRIIKPSASINPMSGSNLNVGLNMVFIIVCLLVVTLTVYQLRKARAKYLAMQAARD